MSTKYHPVHPGRILKKAFIRDFGLTEYRLAKRIGVSRRRINEIIKGQRGITADTALRLSLFFGNSAAFWMELQSRYELKTYKDLHFSRLEKEVSPL